MNIAIRRYTTKTVALVAALFLFAALFIVAGMLVDKALAAPDTTNTTVLAEGERILTIHDRGEERVVITRARTLRTALKSAGVQVTIGHDLVEPALDTELVTTKYNVNIYRARPVTVVDGRLRQRVTTAEQTPEGIAKAAKIVLYKEDEADIQVTSDLLLDGAAVTMTIDRAVSFALSLHGSETTVRTQAATVGDFFKEKSITLGDNDRASHAMDAPIAKDMQLRVWREGKQTITAEQEVDFPTEVIRDANRPAEYKEVQTPGIKGLRSVTYEIVIEDGKEVERKEIASVTTKEPVKQVEVHGAKNAAMPYTGGGNKDTWLAASNIPVGDWGYAEWLVQKESGWNPNAVNRSSGACGLAQALPCSKVPGNPHDPVNSLNWMNNYVNNRYGGWAGAVAHSRAKGWY